MFLDLVWPIFLLLGWERVAIQPGITAVNAFNFLSYPVSHSLSAAVVWGILFASGYWVASGYSGGARILAPVVASHWFLDALTHRPDMPLYPGGPKVGLGLWHSVPATIAVEVPIYLLAVWLYWRCTKYGHWAVTDYGPVASFQGQQGGPGAGARLRKRVENPAFLGHALGGHSADDEVSP